MTLQNRVDPFGGIHAVPERGDLTGNRGVLHDPSTRTLLNRRWTTTAWIICALAHPRGVKREVMGRNARSGKAGWTELFFLDEVTALAAGHRPCFYCRRAAAMQFQHCFAAGNGYSHMTAPQMDRLLHTQRLATSRPTLGADAIRNLPSATMIAAQGQPLAIFGTRALVWSFGGYAGETPLPLEAELLTPQASIAALRNGYTPLWHVSADRPST